MAIYGMGVVLAPAMGPILGGWLTDHYGWPWIFYINVPVSIVGIFMVGVFVHDPAYLRRGRQEDRLAGHRPAGRGADQHADRPGARPARKLVRVAT